MTNSCCISLSNEVRILCFTPNPVNTQRFRCLVRHQLLPHITVTCRARLFKFAEKTTCFLYPLTISGAFAKFNFKIMFPKWGFWLNVNILNNFSLKMTIYTWGHVKWHHKVFTIYRILRNLFTCFSIGPWVWETRVQAVYPARVESITFQKVGELGVGWGNSTQDQVSSEGK